jgi:hypothetical protein
MPIFLCAGRCSRLWQESNPLHSAAAASVAVAIGITGGAQGAEVADGIRPSFAALDDVVDDRPATCAALSRRAGQHGALNSHHAAEPDAARTFRSFVP